MWVFKLQTRSAHTKQPVSSACAKFAFGSIRLAFVPNSLSSMALTIRRLSFKRS